MRRTLMLASVCAALSALVACGGDSGTNVDDDDLDDVQFDPLPSALLNAYCVRGTATAGNTRNGSITDDDCDAADVDPGEDGFFEVWRVRVAQPGVVTFDLTSSFDNYLEVYAMTSYTQTSATVILIDSNDDRAHGNLNALVSVQLNPGIDYFVAVSGYDYGETGPYTLRILR